MTLYSKLLIINRTPLFINAFNTFLLKKSMVDSPESTDLNFLTLKLFNPLTLIKNVPETHGQIIHLLCLIRFGTIRYWGAIQLGQ